MTKEELARDYEKDDHDVDNNPAAKSKAGQARPGQLSLLGSLG